MFSRFKIIIQIGLYNRSIILLIQFSRAGIISDCGTLLVNMWYGLLAAQIRQTGAEHLSAIIPRGLWAG